MKLSILLCSFILFSHSTAFADPGAEEATWESFWSDVRAKNPSLQGKKAETEVARSEIVLPLPPPTIAVGSMGERSPFSGVMERNYEVSQRVPFPTKFLSASKVKAHRIGYAESAEMVESQRIQSDAANVFVSLDENIKAQKILIRHRDELDRHVRRLKSLVISDQAQKIHILAIDAESKIVSADLVELEQSEIAFRNQLGEFLNISGPYTKTPLLKVVPKPPEALAQNKIAAIEAARRAEETSDAEASYAKQVWLPDFSLTYRKRNRFDGVMPSNHEFVIGLEIPFLWGWQSSSGVSAARARADQTRYESIVKRRQVESEISGLQAKVKSDWKRIILFRDEVLPLQEKSITLLHRLTASDMETLDLHRVTLEKWLTDQLKLVRLEGDYRRALTRLEILTRESSQVDSI